VIFWKTGSLEMTGKRPSGRRIKIHRTYTVDEVSRLLRVAKITVRRWLKEGLPSLDDQRPVLILGQDLKTFLKNRRTQKQKCRIDECFCLSCKAPRKPAFNEVEFHPMGPSGGNIRALCEHCSNVMHKRVSQDGLNALKPILTVTEVQAERRLGDGNDACTHDYFNEEPETHA